MEWKNVTYRFTLLTATTMQVDIAVATTSATTDSKVITLAKQDITGFAFYCENTEPLGQPTWLSSMYMSSNATSGSNYYYSSTAGLNDVKNLDKYNVTYTNGKLNVTGIDEYKLDLLDLQGKLVQQYNQDRTGYLLNSGIYLAKITLSDGQTFTKKLFVK